jgi:hypothetical protein
MSSPVSGSETGVTNEPFRVPVHRVLLPENVPAGLNHLLLCSLAYTMRASNDDPPPVRVQKRVDGWWQLEDGRHRFIGAVIAGRPDVLAVEA